MAITLVEEPYGNHSGYLATGRKAPKDFVMENRTQTETLDLSRYSLDQLDEIIAHLGHIAANSERRRLAIALRSGDQAQPALNITPVGDSVRRLN